jgi:sterol desaturase/sphingolipid hydroxylase (fatty acid hydroxylase superfamily)
MKKKKDNKILHFVTWLTGIIVSLSVGFAMVGGTLTLPWWMGGSTLAMIAGWIVVITTIISAVLAVLKY